MLPTELTDAARRATNTFGSNFVSDSELLTYLSFALRELSHYSRCYETIDVVTAVASQATYTVTAAAFEIKQITYDGTKIKPITFREAQAAGYLSQDSNSTGVPAYYYRWANDLVVNPAPSASGSQIQIYSYATHPTVTASSTIYIPETLQHYTIHYLKAMIRSKETDAQGAATELGLWANAKEQAKKEMIQRNRADGYRVVQSEENLVYDPFGLV
jgi:hypothetical protein